MRPLDRLAERAGLERAYHDIWGKEFITPDTSKIALLEALGLPASDEQQQRDSLAELDRREWWRLVPPASVVPAEAQPGSVPVTMTEGPDDRPVTWRLVLEDGAGQSGEMRVADLTPEAWHTVDGQRYSRRRMRLPALPEGYHRLSVSVGGGTAHEGTVIVAPRRCWGPEDVAPGSRFWGVAAQLYSLRSDANWGIGSFSDLGHLAEKAAEAGADLVGLNPLHALAPADPHQASPYSPASRSYLNIAYIDPEAVPDLAESAAARARLEDGMTKAQLRHVRDSEFVDYPAVIGLLVPVLSLMHDSFRTRHEARGTERAKAFGAFRDAAGPRFRAFATFLALQEHLAADDPSMLDWRNWPDAYHDADGPAVARFAEAHAERVDFFEWLQWIADGQLAVQAERAQTAGLRIGLYCDLAVGVGHGSASAWADSDGRVRGVSIGAPPDLLNQRGQNWGLTPLHPLVLRERAFRPFVEVLRANMRHAGALRVDHAMGLMHQYWVPPGLQADQGAYVSYPFEDILRVLALESRRHRCVIIGEDLGTVPEGFRPVMEAAGVLSYRVLMFEQDEHGYKPPDAYPAQALTTAGTHDLATLAGFWTGRDIDWREKLGLYYDDESRKRDREGRVSDKRKLVSALVRAGLWEEREVGRFADADTLDADRLAALYRYLARTPARLLMVQLEDLELQVEQMNLPGTVDEHPNWRRRLGRPVDAIFADANAQAVFAALRAERGGGPE